MPEFFIVHTRQGSAHHAYAFDANGDALTKQTADDLAVRLQFWPSQTDDLHIMILPAEREPELPEP